MTKRILSTKVTNYNPRRKKLDTGLRLVLEFYREPAVKLIAHLLETGYSLEKIGSIVGMSKQAVQSNWLEKDIS